MIVHRLRSTTKFSIAVIITGLVLLLFCIPASGQSAARLALTAPDTKQYPILTTYLSMEDASGGFIVGLRPEDVTVLENGASLPVSALSEVMRNAQFSVAIDADPAMGIRDADGITRFEGISLALQAWANLPQVSPVQDEYAFYTGEGKNLAHLQSRATWLEAFRTYQPDFKTAQPGLNGLTLAIDAFANASSDDIRSRAILWITSPPGNDLLASLPDLADRAGKAGIHLFIWSISSPAASQSPGAAALSQIAQDSGGQYFAFSGVETIPDLDAWLASLRGIYSLSYASAIITAGQHTLQAQVNLPEGQLTSNTQTFNLNILPPNPMLVSPPSVIRRSIPAESQTPQPDLAPLSQNITALVEFPDGYPRPLAVTRLYVDGQVVAERKTAPFDQFEWSLQGYSTSGSHLLSVEAVDSLGLSKRSLAIPVEIAVERPQADPLAALKSLKIAPWWGFVLAGAAGLGCAAIFWSRRRRKQAARRHPQTSKSSRQGAAVEEPARLAVPYLSEAKPGRIGKPMRRRSSMAAVTARLAWLNEDNEPLAAAPIPLAGEEVTFGREAAQATCVLDSPTIDALHARLLYDESGGFVLYDQGSAAGTWVNYAPVSAAGTRLAHGDIVHIGRMAFRFILLQPGNLHKPVIQPYNEAP